MFLGLDNPFQQLWLLGLLVLWGLFLLGGFILGKANEEGTHRMPTWTRMVSSGVLVVAGWSWFLFALGMEYSVLGLLLALGMTLGFIGDLFMAGLIPMGERVVGGIAAFGLGHVVYIVAMIGLGNANGMTWTNERVNLLILWLLFGVMGWYIVVFRGQKVTVLSWAALPYALLLASTGGIATGLALAMPTFVFTAIGAGLFLLSDLILAAQLFNNLHFRLIGDVIWLLYGPAQMAIVYSVAIALFI